jgi:Transposase DDE domain
MERELWTSLYGVVALLDKGYGNWKYSASDILAVFFWAVVHDRPISWAAKREHWSEDLRPKHFPSQSTLSRRMRSASVQELMTQVETTWLAMVGTACLYVRVIDAKGLPVSGVSKDADAGYGRCAGGMAKGYKFFAVWGGGPLPTAWALAPMNKSEKTMARELIPDLPGGGYLLADSEYDSNALYDLAHEAGYQLLAAKRHRKSRGLAHQHHSDYRLRSIELLKHAFGKGVHRFRRQIERDFGALTNCGGGMSPLPAWVRRFPRVRNWVHAKLLAHAVRWFRRHLPAALAVA